MLRKQVFSALLQWGFLCVALPLCVFFIAYYDFLSNYTRELFSYEDFVGQYEHGVYRYRVLGRWGVLAIYQWLASHTELEHHMLPALGARANAAFFFAYFGFNLCWQIALNTTLWGLFRSGHMQCSTATTAGYIAILTAVIGLTQFVITPYDTLNYFLLALTYWLWLEYESTHKLRWLWLGCAVLLLNTLTRESAAIALSAYWAWLYMRKGKLFPRQIMIAVAVFLMGYIGLRLHYGWADAVVSAEYTQGWRLYNFSSPACLIGDMSLVIGLYLIQLVSPSNHRRTFWLCILGCTPYFLMCFYTGITFEIRLWVPVWLMGVLVANTKR